MSGPSGTSELNGGAAVEAQAHSRSIDAAARRLFSTPAARWLSLPVGASMALAFAPFDWWWIAVLGTAYLFLVWGEATPRQAAGTGFLFTAGTYAAGTYWLYHSIYEIGHAPIGLTIFAMAGLVAVMGAYTASVGYALTRWVRIGGAVRTLLVLPAAIALLEWFRGWFLSGFPWLASGYSHLDTPLAGFAPVGGVYTVSFLVCVCAGAVATLLFGNTRERMIAVGAIAAIWLAGFALWKRDWTDPVREPVTVAIVQGAVPQELKWDQEQFEATLDLYRDLTKPHLGADIIVWPESALAAPVEYLHDYLSARWTEARESGSTLVLGQLRSDPETGTQYHNAILALDEQPQWYVKRRLVPLAEYFPVPKFVRDWLKGLDLPYSGFQAGKRSQPALDAAGEKLGPTICYEDAYASDQLEVLREATLLVNVTNDAWFGDSSASHQHLQISRMRALEAGRTMLRAANDGISAIIGPHGELERTLPRFEPGVLTGAVQPRIGLTPYARVGNWPIVIACMLIIAFGVLYPRRR
ncbi:MAG TPA: apolipoprotein N-acyltransferase [Steroidobacteraceae bacterium]